MDNVHLVQAAGSVNLNVSSGCGSVDVAQVIGHECVEWHAAQPFHEFERARVVLKKLLLGYLSVRLAKVAVQIERNRGPEDSGWVHFGYVQRLRAAQRIHQEPEAADVRNSPGPSAERPAGAATASVAGGVPGRGKRDEHPAQHSSTAGSEMPQAFRLLIFPSVLRTSTENLERAKAARRVRRLLGAACRRALAHHAGSAYNMSMQYTIRNVPAVLDDALRKRARETGKRLNETALDALAEGAGLAAVPVRKRRDLSDLVGKWRADPALEEALADQDRIDPDLWR
jgi:hypothetical protein